MKDSTVTREQLEKDMVRIVQFVLNAVANGANKDHTLDAIQRASRLGRAAGMSEAQLNRVMDRALHSIPNTLSVPMAVNLAGFLSYSVKVGEKLMSERAKQN